MSESNLAYTEEVEKNLLTDGFVQFQKDGVNSKILIDQERYDMIRRQMDNAESKWSWQGSVTWRKATSYRRTRSSKRSGRSTTCDVRSLLYKVLQVRSQRPPTGHRHLRMIPSPQLHLYVRLMVSYQYEQVRRCIHEARQDPL